MTHLDYQCRPKRAVKQKRERVKDVWKRDPHNLAPKMTVERVELLRIKLIGSMHQAVLHAQHGNGDHVLHYLRFARSVLNDALRP